jgi:hypothetical protein
MPQIGHESGPDAAEKQQREVKLPLGYRPPPASAVQRADEISQRQTDRIVRPQCEEKA